MRHVAQEVTCMSPGLDVPCFKSSLHGGILSVEIDEERPFLVEGALRGIE